ncbi:MAG TPA: hypothetical protein PLD88_02815, partial [Candidatus Berkiella sp.]|nr:hypothetical protein [Candidatus Berkiella sp.]
MLYASTHVWKNTDKVVEEDLFLKRQDYPSLYESEAKPIEQLSAKGLALMSYLYSIKDDNQSQPVIVSTQKDYDNIIKEFAKTKPDTELTMIVQLTDANPKRLFAAMIGHKTVVKLERTNSGINLISIDSTNSDTILYAIDPSHREILPENMELEIYHQQPVKVEKKEIRRQIDGY